MPETETEQIESAHKTEDEVHEDRFALHAKIYSPIEPHHILIDEASAQTAEIHTLVERLPLQTQLGRDTTYARLVEGAPPEVIYVRQRLIHALATHPEVRAKLVEKIRAYGEREQEIADFLGGHIQDATTINPYKVTKQRRKILQEAVLGIAEALRELEDEFDLEFPVNPKARDFSQKSPELKALFAKKFWNHLVTYESETEKTWLGRPRTYGRREISLTRPGFDHSPFRFHRFSSYRSLVLLAGLIGLDVKLNGVVSAVVPAAWVVVYYGTVKPVMDGSFTNLPRYAKLLADSEALPIFAEALGEVDMLCTYAELLADDKTAMCLPYISDSDQHRFMARGLRNPIIALSGGPCVPNNVDFKELVFITGLNSGGKSTLEKAFVQNQVQAQCGLAVFADFLVISRADRIAYIPSASPDIDDGDGRLGFDFSRINPVMYNATPRTVTLLDDCVQGTTFSESLEILNYMMQGFSKLGGTTVFATHAHELVSAFAAANDGQFLKMERVDRKPTFKIVPGVSTYSAAEVVAEKHGLDRDSIQSLLESRGLNGEFRELNLSSLQHASNGDAETVSASTPTPIDMFRA